MPIWRGYGVSTKALNQALRRNRERFPEDFVFQLKAKEFALLRPQIVTSNAEGPESHGLRSNWSQFVMSSLQRRGGRRYRPYAFTEQGVAMLSSVLRSRRAVEVNIAIMRTFVQLRRLMDTNRDLARKIEALEKKYDEQFAEVFAAIKEPHSYPKAENERTAYENRSCRARENFPGK